jgi:hypothetical protein
MTGKKGTQEQIAARCNALAVCANSLLQQIPTVGNRTYQYYYGVLIRYRTVLGDITRILQNNSSTHISSAFILFRVLIDDMIRLITVWASQNPCEILDQIDADAISHSLKSKTLRVDYSIRFIPDESFGEQMSALLETEKTAFFSDQKNSHLFENQEQKKFKKLPPISDAFTNLETHPDWNIKALNELFVLYKELSGHIHYAPVVFWEDRDDERRENEIAYFEAVQIYLYKELLIHLSFFKQEHQSVELKCSELEIWFKGAVVMRK